MAFSLLLLVFYLAWAGWIWRTAPPVISEQELLSEEFRYSYATTPLRRAVVMTGSWLLFGFILWLITYSISFLIWQTFFAEVDDSTYLYHNMLLGMVAIVVSLVLRIPIFRRFTNEICGFFQRAQFFPMLPSIREEQLIEKIATMPLDTIPKEIKDALNLESVSVSEDYKKEVFDDYVRLEIIYRELQKIAKQHNLIVRRFYFGEDWEMIKNQFTVIDRQMNANDNDADATLAKNIKVCLHYCYSLLTRVIIETASSPEDAKKQFKYFGFDLDM